MKNFKLKGISPRVNQKRQIVRYAVAGLGLGSKEKPGDSDFRCGKRTGHKRGPLSAIYTLAPNRWAQRR